MTDVVIISVRNDGIDGASCEYFCTDCLQLRLSFRDETVSCYNCGSKQIIVGTVGSLDKIALLNEYG